MSVVSVPTNANLDENDEEKLPLLQKARPSYNKMFYIGREICFFLLILFTTYASLNLSGNSGHGPPAIRFFPRGSLVSDFYKGELAEALLHASEADVSFIMYYAPWDADSQAARPHFQALALQHYKQVYFAGINCWQPRSDCRRSLSKIHQFPKLVVYVSHETGVEYRGPRNSQYMSSFLEAVMRPIHRLHTPADLTRLRAEYNAVVVAYINFLGLRGGLPYRIMYEAALKFLERDVRQEVAFAVVTSFKSALEFGANRTPSIRLYLWNETVEYSGLWLTERLADWVGSKLHQVTVWLSPPGAKSLTLASYLQHGPALLMFTPFDNYVMYNLLREVGLEYHNCHNRSDITQLAHHLSNHVSERIARTRRMLVSCQSRRPLTSTVTVLGSVWNNSTLCHCSAPPSPSPLLVTSKDPRSASALTDWWGEESCERVVPPPPRLPATPTDPLLRGLACRHNQTISLLALDSQLFGHFAQGLGVDPDLASHHTSVLLLNSQMETTHTLEEPITRASLSEFLVNFTNGRLERFQRTQVPGSALPHHDLTVFVRQLTTDTFLPVAFNDSLNVVVLYYTPYCAFCHAAGPAYLSVVRMLRDVPSLTFTRLNGEANDLPWQFTVPHYPSILFFPARRKSESRVFLPQNAVTVDSLTQFVLANLPLELRLVAMLQLCQRYPEVLARRRECLTGVRYEVQQAISAQLVTYRTIARRIHSSLDKRTALGQVVIRLQQLRRLQVMLTGSSGRAVQLATTIAVSRLAHDEL